MLKLLNRIVFLFVGAGLLVTTFVSAVPPDQGTYLTAAADKHRRLQSIEGPRVILVGGSGVAFGFDSQRIEQELGMPVVNTGLHVSLGLRYMLSEVRRTVRAGDVVVVVPEYVYFVGGLRGGDRMLQLLNVFPDGWRYDRSFDEYLALGKAFPIYVQFKFEQFIHLALRSLLGTPLPQSDTYSRDAFNQYGDVVSHLDQAGVRDIPILKWSSGELNSDVVVVLNQFAEETRRAGARSIYLPQSISGPAYDRNQDTIDQIHRMLKSDLKMEIASDPERYVVAYDRLHDTREHLNAQGQQERTALIIEDLRSILHSTGG